MPSRLRLVLPTIKYYKSFITGLRSMVGDSSRPGDISQKRFQEIASLKPEEYIKKLKDKSRGVNVPKGKVPETDYWLVDGKNYIGTLHLRHKLNEKLKKEGGHIGYVIAPKFRGKGYGNSILGLGLKKAKSMGLKKVLITCDKSNTRSRKIIENNGGILKKEAVSPKTGKKVFQYTISL